MNFYGVLPDRFIVAEWRELVAIKRQWEKGTLKHRLVSYVMNYDKSFFIWYVCRIVAELEKRKIKYNENLKYEIWDFAPLNTFLTKDNYPEHNDRYLKQCYYNLQEKYDRRNYN